MTRPTARAATERRVAIIGAGIAGLWQALTFARAGYDVTLYDSQSGIEENSASAIAGAMLAPQCERESSKPIITTLGEASIDIWRAEFPDIAQNGTLVIAHARDLGELDRFARSTPDPQHVNAAGVAELEPDLGDRFSRGLFYPDEAHVNPRKIMGELLQRIQDAGASVRFGEDGMAQDHGDALVIDCRGMAARDQLPELRGVKGEMLVLHTNEVNLSRPVRFMHPRHPLYIVPWGGGDYMVGATMIEADGDMRVTARSVLELLSAAYSVHPAFGEAEIVEMRAGLRPAFVDNMPKITRAKGAQQDMILVNGMYRHGFLLSPVMAKMTLDLVENDITAPEIIHED